MAEPSPPPRSGPPRSGERGPFRPQVWRSPLRGPWLTAALSAVLLVGIPVVVLTGLVSYVAYGPQFDQALPSDPGWLQLPVFAWPTRPVWLYRLTQGTHVVLGLALIPVVLAKLWSVMPKLFDWPPVKSVAQLLERLSLALLVGGILFEIVTGVLNIQYYYAFGFDFYTAHYYGAWVFIGALVAHIVLKVPAMLRGLRSLSLRTVLRTPASRTRPEPPDEDGLVAVEPARPTMSRRGALGLVGGGALLVAGLSAPASLGDAVRSGALLLPRGTEPGDGPTDFQVNKTAATAGITDPATGPGWRLTLLGGAQPVVLDRAALAALPQRTATLPIACVEGWSTTQEWSGVPLAELARLAGVPEPASAEVRSLEQVPPFNRATLASHQVLDPDALLALRVNGVDLSLDHGYPARAIVPALPGVHNTKWVREIEFRRP